MQNKRRTINIFAIFLTILIFYIWATLVATNNSVIASFDNTFINLIYGTNKATIKFAKFYTEFASTPVMTGATIVGLVLFWIFKKRNFGLLFGLTMAAANGANTIIKKIIKRPRPTVKHLTHAGGYSFPSGHSIASMTIALLLILALTLYMKNKGLKTFLIIILALFPISIGWSRIFTHVHYPSDVFGGFLLSFVFIAIAIFIVNQKPHWFLPDHVLVASKS